MFSSSAAKNDLGTLTPAFGLRVTDEKSSPRDSNSIAGRQGVCLGDKRTHAAENALERFRVQVLQRSCEIGLSEDRGCETASARP